MRSESKIYWISFISMHLISISSHANSEWIRIFGIMITMFDVHLKISSNTRLCFIVRIIFPPFESSWELCFQLFGTSKINKYQIFFLQNCAQNCFPIASFRPDASLLHHFDLMPPYCIISTWFYWNSIYIGRIRADWELRYMRH